jgi:hypothetical protein
MQGKVVIVSGGTAGIGNCGTGSVPGKPTLAIRVRRRTHCRRWPLADPGQPHKLKHPWLLMKSA